MSADSTLNRLGPTEVELDIPVSPQELRAAEDRAFRKLARNAKVPGFRPGKVPRKIFEQQYGDDVIHSRAIDDVVPEAYSRAVREHDLAPIDRPKVEVLPAESDGPLHLKVNVAVRPDIELHAYSGIELDRPAVKITDEEVDRSLQALARDRGTLVPVERPAQLGDFVVVDYRGQINGQNFEGGAAEGQTIELSEERFVPGFAAGIVGMQAGEKREVHASFPREYTSQEVAGQDALFEVTLHEVKVMELPQIDDEFAKSASTHASLNELKSDIRRRLEVIGEGRVRKQLQQALMSKLLDTHEFPLPPVLVERETESSLADAHAFAERMGLSWDDYLSRAGKSEERLREELKTDAERRVKGALLLAAIAKREDIRATPADVQREIVALAEQYGQPPQRIREAMGNNIGSLMEGIVRSKTMEWLIEHATMRTIPDGA
ncbi:MAG: trigger factor [Candidatus Eremiobacteraeota bacterium]|nr:trigger factor [Candidatus Eremiobacteraeota bacterium]